MSAGGGTITCMRFWILLLTGFPLFAAAANVCAPAPRIPGTPIEAPHAVFDAYVVEVNPPHISASAFGVQRTQRALVEVIRSFHGPYSPGQQVETLTIQTANACGAVNPGTHVLVGSDSGGPFEIIEVFPEGRVVPHGPFVALALAAEEPRHSKRRTLKNVSLRGSIDAGLAAKLHAQAQPPRREQSEIRGVGNYAQVSWGKAFGGNDARGKVIYELTVSGWVEILRYEAPTPTPVRKPARRGKQRSLWAGNGDIPRFLANGDVPLLEEQKA